MCPADRSHDPHDSSPTISPDDAVVVTGIGVVSPIGTGCDAFLDSLRAGRHGIRAVTRFDTAIYDSRVGGTLADAGWDAAYAARATWDVIDPVSEVSCIAAQEAWRRARLDGTPPARIAVILGTTAGGLGFRSAYEFAPREDIALRRRLLERSAHNQATAAVADSLGITGPRITISTACTSSANALGHAFDLIRSGNVDVVLAGGVDFMVEEMFAGFHSMGAMSASACAPFSEPSGVNVSEGAGFVVLERAQHARRRGADVRCEVLGYATSLDAFHAISPDPTGSGVARAIAAALAHARVETTDIGYLNAHGTGTEANDASEWSAIQRVFGDGANALPVSSTKSYFGHTFGAAGVLEFAASVMCLEDGTIPPTLNFTGLRGAGPRDPVAATVPRKHAYRVGLTTNAAFGGANAAVVYGVPGSSRRAPARGAARIVILGSSVVAAHGTTGFDAAYREGRPLGETVDVRGRAVRVARVPAFKFESVVRGVDPRGMDTAGRLLTVATAVALREAGVKITNASRDRTGLVVATTTPSADNGEDYWRSIRERGHARLSAPAFARIVVNAAAGTASRALSLRGPVSVLSGGAGSTLGALAIAAEMLTNHDDADILAVGAVYDVGLDTLADMQAAGDGGASSDSFGGQGAVGFALAREGAIGSAPIADVIGSGLAGPADLPRAIQAALSAAQCDPTDVDALYVSADVHTDGDARESAALLAIFGDRARALRCASPSRVFGNTDMGDALAVAAALESVRTGTTHARESSRRVRTALVVSAHRVAGSFAVLLRRQGA